MRATGLEESQWSLIDVENMYGQVGIPSDRLVQSEQLEIVLPDAEWLEAQLMTTSDAIEVLTGKLHVSRMAAQRLALLLDTNGDTTFHVKTLVAVMHALCGSTSTEAIERNLHLYQLGTKHDLPLPQRIYDFLRPYMMLALDAAEGMSFIVSDLYGNDRAAKHRILEFAHDHVCDYADLIGNSLASFLRQRATGQEASIQSIARYLDDSFGFSRWATDVANEYIMNADKFRQMKSGLILRQELAKYMNTSNQFTNVAPGSLWWNQVVLNREYQSMCMPSYSNWDGALRASFEIERMWEMQSHSLDGTITAADAERCTDAAGMQSMVGLSTVLCQIYNSGRREITVMWPDFVCGCMLLGSAPVPVKFQRMVQYLVGPDKRKPLKTSDITTLAATVVKAALFNVQNLNDTMARLCGYKYEPDWVSKSEQFKTMTMTAAETTLNQRVTASTETLLRLGGTSGTVTKEQTMAWVQANVEFQRFMTTTSVWLQHSILERCAPEQGSTTVAGVHQILSRCSIASIKPIVDTYIHRARAGPNFLMEMTQALGLKPVVRTVLSDLLTDNHDGNVDVREGSIICALLCCQDS
eukprot:COSAG01_NODE_9382_length_2462_cov_1.012696_2_plen_582_part_01